MTSQALAVYTAFNRIGLYNEPSWKTDRKALAAALRALDEQLGYDVLGVRAVDSSQIRLIAEELEGGE
jgi:hypothetical protein